MRRKSLLAAAVLVVVANAIALLGVARNRASTLQTIDLTERELTLGYQDEENSGIDLHLAVNYVPGLDYGSGLDWLDAAKLKELGFPASVSSIKEHRDWPARPAYVAFEYDGPAWQAVAAREREIQRQFQRGSFESKFDREPRLVAIDASSSSETLLAKYGSTGRRLILHATVQPQLARQDGKSIVRGHIAEILGPQIHVPLPAATVLPPRGPPQYGPPARPRYTIRLAFGARFEPWIISVTALPK
jgi:hypothetical protein